MYSVFGKYQMPFFIPFLRGSPAPAYHLTHTHTHTKSNVDYLVRSNPIQNSMFTGSAVVSVPALTTEQGTSQGQGRDSIALLRSFPFNRLSSSYQVNYSAPRIVRTMRLRLAHSTSARLLGISLLHKFLPPSSGLDTTRARVCTGRGQRHSGNAPRHTYGHNTERRHTARVRLILIYFSKYSGGVSRTAPKIRHYDRLAHDSADKSFKRCRDLTQVQASTTDGALCSLSSLTVRRRTSRGSTGLGIENTQSHLERPQSTE